MADHLESLISRFLATAGLVENNGYHTIEALLDERSQPFFGGRESLHLAFSPEAFHEHPEAELVTYGSSFLETLDRLANNRGNAVHLYLNGLNPTTGRTLEKVRAQVRIPGHLLESGGEQILLFHHVLFCFKTALIGEEREEFFQDIAVDLHTGWTTQVMDEQILRLYLAGEPVYAGELRLRLSLNEAYLAASRVLQDEIGVRVKTCEEELRLVYWNEQKQVSEHYAALLAKMEAGKGHKGADLERLEAKIKATRTDLGLRLSDLEKRYRPGLELRLTQLAVISYLKAVVPLFLQQGKETRHGLAIWDSLTRQGYFSGI